MALQDVINSYAKEFGAELGEKKGVYSFSKVIAERKAFLSKKKLTYTAKFRVDEEAKTLKFTEMLMEQGSGFSSGGDFDGGMSTGFGFKAETYKSGMGGREGNIEEQSKLFGKDYTYNFNYQEVRQKFEQLAKDSGYAFAYQITPMGL
jgi:hypothetical protein